MLDLKSLSRSYVRNLSKISVNLDFWKFLEFSVVTINVGFRPPRMMCRLFKNYEPKLFWPTYAIWKIALQRLPLTVTNHKYFWNPSSYIKYYIWAQIVQTLASLVESETLRILLWAKKNEKPVCGAYLTWSYQCIVIDLSRLAKLERSW